MHVHGVPTYTDVSMATGPDRIGRRIPIMCPGFVHSISTFVFSRISSRIFPVDKFIYQVTPIFKAGDKMSVYNYRTISLRCK